MQYSKLMSAKFYTEINGAEQEIEISWTQKNEGQGIDVVIDDNGGVSDKEALELVLYHHY